MKPQDFAFFIVLLVLLIIPKFRKPPVFVISGLLCILLSMPLFGFWIFFTAQHLIWYSVGFFTVAIGLYLIHNK